MARRSTSGSIARTQSRSGRRLVGTAAARRWREAHPGRALLAGDRTPPRAKGHDVVAVAERVDLIGLSDEELFQRMALEERAVMTNNVKDFVPLAHRAAVEGRDHSGLLLTADKSMSRRPDAIDRTVDALHEFLSQHHDKGSCRNQTRWLGAARP